MVMSTPAELAARAFRIAVAFGALAPADARGIFVIRVVVFFVLLFGGEIRESFRVCHRMFLWFHLFQICSSFHQSSAILEQLAVPTNTVPLIVEGTVLLLLSAMGTGGDELGWAVVNHGNFGYG